MIRSTEFSRETPAPDQTRERNGRTRVPRWMTGLRRIVTVVTQSGAVPASRKTETETEAETEAETETETEAETETETERRPSAEVRLAEA